MDANHNPAKVPLNGTKTHPLSESALGALRSLAHGPIPRQEVNPGVANRLEREDLVDEVDLPSPYKTHKGKKIRFLQINDAGRARLEKGA